MNDAVFEILDNYFDTLALTGYTNYDEVHRVLFITIMQDLASHDYNGFLTESDYKLISWALYNIYGTSCIITFPTVIKSSYTSDDYIGVISDTAQRFARVETAISEIQNTNVVQTLSDSIIINDIQI